MLLVFRSLFNNVIDIGVTIVSHHLSRTLAVFGIWGKKFPI